MSRYRIVATNPTAHSVWVGWDAQMQTYFGQVFALGRNDDELLLAVGDCECEIQDTASLAVALANYAQLTTETAALLQRDRATPTQPNAWQSQQIETDDLLIALEAARNKSRLEVQSIEQLHRKLQRTSRNLPPKGRLLLELLDLSAADPHPPDHEERDPYGGDHRPRVRAIGERIHQLGGFALMRDFYYQVYPYDRRALEIAWDGIGEWLA